MGRSSALLLVLSFLLPGEAAGTAEHVRIEGTRVHLRVPGGFAVSQDFPGLGRDADLSSVLVSELPAPFATVREGFGAEALAERGLRLHRTVEVEVAGHGGLLLHATQRAGGVDFRKWLLLLGDERRSVLLTATTPLDLEAVHARALVETLKTARWDPALEAGPQDALPFRVAEAAPLAIVGSAPNAVVLSDPDHDPGRGVAPLVVAGASLSRVQIADLAEFARRRLSETVSIEDIEVASQAERSLDGMPGHEIRAAARDVQTGRAVRVVQLLATDGARYYMLQGIVDAEQAAAFAPLFDQVVASFARER